MHSKTPAALVPLIPKLMRRARRLSPTPVEAEDMVQDTLLSLCHRLDRGGEIEDLPAYAMRALAHNAKRVWRRPVSVELDENSLTILPDAMQRLDCADTLAAIARLPEAHRQLLEIVIEGETSPRIIAERTGLPVGTVMSRLSRARSRLRADLGLGR